MTGAASAVGQPRVQDGRATSWLISRPCTQARTGSVTAYLPALHPGTHTLGDGLSPGPASRHHRGPASLGPPVSGGRMYGTGSPDLMKCIRRPLGIVTHPSGGIRSVSGTNAAGSDGGPASGPAYHPKRPSKNFRAMIRSLSGAQSSEATRGDPTQVGLSGCSARLVRTSAIHALPDGRCAQVRGGGEAETGSPTRPPRNSTLTTWRPPPQIWRRHPSAPNYPP